jgi:hypothetical protein
MKHFIPLIFLLLCGCKEEYPSIPKDIIPMEEMKKILTDMHITDSVAETKAQAGADERALTVQYNEQIFKNHGITHQQFMKSYKFYESNPKLFDKMYDEILVELSKREEKSGKK